MSASLAVVPRAQESSRPDVAWMKRNVSVFEVAKALGMRIRHRKAKCWRTENHRHGDADPSLHFYEGGNRVRCFVCDMRGGHSNIDMVMGVLSIPFGDAVRWIAERFTVPNVKRGRPVGSRAAEAVPYRVGVHGSEWEVIVRSGMWGTMSAAERSILVVLDHFKDPETGITRLSYRAIMRYSGVRMMGNVSNAIKELKKMHVLQAIPGPRVGITRECSSYRVTLNEPRFLDLCNEVCRASREEIAQERDYRKELRSKRQDGARPLTPSNPPQEGEQEAPTCEGLNLSSIREAVSNKALLAEKREISIPVPDSDLDHQNRERGWLQ